MMAKEGIETPPFIYGSVQGKFTKTLVFLSLSISKR